MDHFQKYAPERQVARLRHVGLGERRVPNDREVAPARQARLRRIVDAGSSKAVKMRRAPPNEIERVGVAAQ